jgi:polysaccharide deacetylase family protein (PEP-CTERM system associated)
MHSSEPIDRPLNALTVDVEEHFQVSAFEEAVPRAGWDAMESRVEANTGRLLDLFDEAGVRATFFVLGWIAERRPGLVGEIARRGHEVASHGYDHKLVYRQTPQEFRAEAARTRDALEQASGQQVRGYRAASFSITRESLWALDELVETGHEYDSSIYPVYHDRYGLPGAPRGIHRLRTPGDRTLIEVPPTTVRLGRLVLPALGGGYLRIYPLWLNRLALRRVNEAEGRSAVLYLHPWEVDPEQPRIRARLASRLRHYTHLSRTMNRLRALFSSFAFGPVREVIERQGNLAERGAA